MAKPRVTTELVLAGHPAVRHVIPPRVKHLSTLLMAGAIPHLQRHVAVRTPVLVSCPLLRERQAEVEQGMLVPRDVAHEHAHLAVVNFAPVTAPLALDADRVRAALGEATGIERDEA